MSSDTRVKRFNADISVHVHTELKIASAKTGRSMGKIVEEALKHWLELGSGEERRR